MKEKKRASRGKEKVAKNTAVCFVCSQSVISERAIYAMMQKGKILNCRWCGAQHTGIIDEAGYGYIAVIGVKI